MIKGRYGTSSNALGELYPSIGALLKERAESWPDFPVLAYRDVDDQYRPVPWREFLRDVGALATHLYRLGLRRGDRAAVLSPNSYAMLVWEMAVTSMGAISVPIFAGYDVAHIDNILQHAEPKALLVDGADRLEKCRRSSAFDRIQTVITRHPSRALLLDECLEGGDMDLYAGLVADVDPADVCFLQYTSGTTGSPKGVMLTHRNIMSQRKGMSQVWEIPHKSRFLSYLPWHHSFGGLFERFAALYHGATIYLEDSFGKRLERLLENWAVARPTQFFSVPKIYIALVSEARANTEVEQIIFHPELKFAFTAAAPLPKECAAYFKSKNVPVVEGWGLTETSPLVTFTPFDVPRGPACVGHPIAGCEVLIDESGEILVRGPNIMKGYYREPDRTASVIDALGWFHTGDIGELCDDGLHIIGRIDGQFKLANGEKVSSMVVENAVTITSQWIQHALTVGAAETFVGALIFPNFRALSRWAKGKGRELPAGWDLAQDPDVQRLVADEIQANMADFQPKYMRVKSFVVVPKELTIEDGEVTPSMKVIRHHVLAKYEECWQAIYRPDQFPRRKACVVATNL